ncbi:MAG TPA: ATP-binding protein, partial [Nitrospiria bacterium]
VDHSIQQARLLALASDIRDGVEKANVVYEERTYRGEDLLKRAENLEMLLNRPMESQKFIDEFLKNPASEFIKGSRRKLFKQKETLSVIITDQHGFLIATDVKPKKVFFGDQEWWRAAFNNGLGSIYISDVHSQDDSEKPEEKQYSLSIAVPIMDDSDSKAIGILKTELRARTFFNTVTKVHIGRADHTMLASSDGTLIFCPVFKIRNHTLNAEVMDTIFKDRPGWNLTKADVHYPGQNAINGFAPFTPDPELVNFHPSSFGGKEWYIFTSQDPLETYAPVMTLLNWILIIGALAFVILTILGLRAAGLIVQPLKDLQKGAKLIGFGNLDHRLKINSRDEIQDLADEFNEMAIKLQSSYSGLEQKVAERTRELEVVNKITRIISSSLDLNKVFESFCDEVKKLLHSDRISLSLMDETLQHIQMRLIKTQDLPLASHNAPRNKSGTAIGWVVDHRKPFVREDVLDQSTFVEDRLVRQEGLRSYICVPLISQETVMGTLNLASAKPGEYNDKNLAILEPIAEQLAIAIETNRLFEQTKKLDQLKSDFVSKVSHEFRTPLTSIKGFTEILLSYNDVDVKTQKDFIAIIHEESERLTRLINDILDLSKIEAGRSDWTIQPLSPFQIVTRAVKSVQAISMEKNLPIIIEVSKNLPSIQGDMDKLIQVMENLLSNAIKFTSRGKIMVQATLEDTFVRFAISDTGIGIPPDEIEKIFDRFIQLGDTKTGKPKGTGLGLSICREIIQYLGGKIWCESEENRGSTFLFHLPLWTEESPVLPVQPHSRTALPPSSF